MILSIDAGDVFSRVQHVFMMEVLKKKIYFNIIKAMHDKCISLHYCKWRKTENSISSKMMSKSGMPSLFTLTQYNVQSLS